MKKDKFNLQSNEKKKMIEDIMYFFATELDENIGELKAYNVLDFIIEGFAVDFYNKGLDDAKTFMQTQVEELYSLEKIKDMRRKK